MRVSVPTAPDHLARFFPIEPKNNPGVSRVALAGSFPKIKNLKEKIRLFSSRDSKRKVYELIAIQMGVEPNELDENEQLFTQTGGIDSVGLVELCVNLEDLAASIGFDFDWTSERAMSENFGMFRTVQSLSSEFERQKSEKTE